MNTKPNTNGNANTTTDIYTEYITANSDLEFKMVSSGSWLGNIHIDNISVKEVNFNKLDGRRKEFKEKVRKLYYEKIRKEQEAVTAEAKKEETKKPNKISINPDLKEYKGYDLAKKFFIKNKQPEFTEEEQNILKTIKV